jgi:signal transduction histidine kinase
VLSAFVALRDSGGTLVGAMEVVRLADHVDAKIRAARLDLGQRIGLLTLLVAVLLSVGARWSVILPVRRLMRGVEALAAGRSEPIGARGRDELAELARAFDEMAERLTAAQRQAVAESEARLDQARQLRQAERLAVAGRIASEVVHEIGTPLNIISGRAEQALRDLPDGDGRASALRTVLAQIDRIRGILTSLLDGVRPRKAEVQLVTLHQALAGLVDLLRPTARARGLQLTAAIDPEAQAMADPNQLQQVLLNLLMNAIEATPPGGRVSLEVRRATAPDGRPGAELRVIDSGSGIPPEHQARVFDPFFTTKPPGQGTGLGLAIAQGIVTDHGGRIEVTSVVGRGSIFRVVLPL